jgi:carbon starvation protein
VLTQPFLGGAGAVAVLTTFFGLVLVIYALTVQALVTRFFRLVVAEGVGEGPLRTFGNKHVATTVGLLIPYGFAITGSWWALWLYFGGTNQLLAGLAIMLITIHLSKTHAPSKFTLIPATFMIVTTLAALLWEAWLFFRAIVNFYFLGSPTLLEVREPIRSQYTLLALGLNAMFVFIGGFLFVLGLSMTVRLYRSYFQSRAEVRAAPAAAPGGGGGR